MPMRRIFETLLLALPVVLAAAVSCTENIPEARPKTNDAVYLQIGSVTTSELTRAAIQQAKFPAALEVSIGIFLAGDDYTDAKYKNIKYTKPAGAETWPDPLIELQEGEATVYAYYPYQDDITDIAQIPVASSVNGDDWMWATPVKEVSTAKPAIDLTFNHALALVEITFNVYGPESTMTNVTLAGSDDGTFSKAGTMDATDGAITPDTAQKATKTSLFSQEVNLPLTDGKIIADCLLVPGNTGEDADARQDFCVKCTYNGKTYNANLTGDKGVIIRKNTKSTIVLNIKDNILEVVSVGVSSWGDTNVSGSTATVGGHTVTFNCPEGLKYELYTESVSTAIPDDTTAAGTARTVILRYDKTSIPDGRFFFLSEPSGCSFTFDEQSGIITVTDITGNVTVNLGFGTYIPYTAAAKVEPNNKSAFGFPYDEARSTFSTDSKSGVIAIDGIVTSIGKNAFKSDIKLTSVTIPEGVALIGESAFTSCKNLTSVSFSSGLTTIGNSAFDACDKLTNINFEKCTNLTAIGSTAFFNAGSDAGCSPFSLVLPEGLVEIGASAFNGSKISSVTLPSTLSAIGNSAFYRCGSLKTITSKAGNPPTLGTYVFYDLDASYNFVPLKSIEDIFVPDASVDTYKAADGWDEFSDKIKGIQE